MIGSFINSARSMAIPILRPALVGIRHQRMPKQNFIISGFPKSGSTYLRFLVYSYLSQEAPCYELMEKTIPYVGSQLSPTIMNYSLFKTHEKPSQRYCSGVHLVRDGRAVAWSLYRAALRREQTTLCFPEFLRRFTEGKIGGYGSWQDHTLEWHSFTESNQNWLVIHYETLVSNPQAVLRQVLNALGMPEDPQRSEVAISECSVEKIRAAELSAPMFRKVLRNGKAPIVGDGLKKPWSAAYSEEDLELFEERAGKALRMIEQYASQS